MKNALVYFAAGCLGALANSLLVWLLGDSGTTRSLGIAMAPSLSPNWLYPRIVWGGIWGFLFFLPLYRSKPIIKGSLLSLLPTMVQLFIIFPYSAQKGIGGVKLGTLTPLFVLFVNWVWGVVTSLTIRYSK